MKTNLRNLRRLILGLSLSFLLAPASGADTAKRGAITGGVEHQAPSWFKESFLEIQDDVEEATEANKHVILFFQLNGCPYCDRMLSESFEPDAQREYIEQHFDTIALNVGGDREIVFNEQVSLIEKELAEMLEVRATPAIVFLNSDNKSVVRVNGYRSTERFNEVLHYVADKAYQQGSLAAYLDQKLPKDVYTLRDNDLFVATSDLSAIKGPLAIVFEDSSCYDCNEFHNTILSREAVQQELKPFTIVRLDAASEQKIIDTDGTETTARALATKHEMIYRPGVLLFDDGLLVRRYDSLLFPHHFKEGFRYVAGGYYKTQDYQTYSEARTEELLVQGVNIDLGR